MLTIITITLNNLNGLKRTIDSVRSQTCQSFEYIIIDGASTDGTQEFLHELSSKNWWNKGKNQMIIGKDSGIYNAMNKGVGEAHGEFCLFLNSGDTLYDINVIQSITQQIGTADIYSGNTHVIGSKKTFFAPHKLSLMFFIDLSLAHPSTVIRTSLLVEMPFNEDLHIVSDWEFFLKQYLKGINYKRLNFFISNFYYDGISSKNQTCMNNERTVVLQRLLPSYELRDYRQFNRFEKKIHYALTKPPIQRDIKILRNAFKALIKDAFYIHT